MSIQQSLRSSILYKIIFKFKIIHTYDACLKIVQFLNRKLFFLINFKKKPSLNVFFEYFNHSTHPEIKKRYYGKRAPTQWSTLNSSKVVHCIQSTLKKYSGKKIIVEPNDHVLVIGASLGIFKPSELVRRRIEISDFISSPAISRVLIGNNDLIHHAKYYYSDNALKKFLIYPEFSCIPKVSGSLIKEKNKKLLINDKIKFLSIASNFEKKAVDLLLKAFIESKSKGELTLVCHDISESLESKISKMNNINLIKDLPLSSKKKDYLYRNSDIYINTTHIDGGAVAVNALEYGLPIITNTYHRGKSFIDNNNGILLSEPMKYYDPNKFGVNWNSISDYLEQVDMFKKKGGYDDLINQFINAFNFYEQNSDNIYNHSINSLELAHKYSLEKSNQILRELYVKVAKE